MSIKQVSKNLIKGLIHLLGIALVAKGISLYLYYKLPKEGISKIVVTDNTPDFENYGLTKLFAIVERPPPPPEAKVRQTIDIENCYLRSSYYMPAKKDGFVMVEDIRTPNKLETLTIGSPYKGAKLQEIGTDFAVFIFPDKERYTMRFKPKNPLVVSAGQPMQLNLPPNLVSQPPISAFGTNMIPKKDISPYLGDLNMVWKEVAFNTVKDGADLKGYKVTFIKPGSILETKIGLMLGDVVTAVNGKKLQNDSDALVAYKNMSKQSKITITVLRGEQEKELKYEVY